MQFEEMADALYPYMVGCIIFPWLLLKESDILMISVSASSSILVRESGKAFANTSTDKGRESD